MMRIRRTVSRTDVEARPELVWNAFVDLLASESYEDLSTRQRIAHLVFWYDAEVGNGGHGQYFDNIGFARAKEAVFALRAMALDCQAGVLQAALQEAEQRLTGKESDPIPTGVRLPAFIRWLLRRQSHLAMRHHGPNFDDAYHACSPTVTEALEGYLAVYRDEFIEFR